MSKTYRPSLDPEITVPLNRPLAVLAAGALVLSALGLSSTAGAAATTAKGTTIPTYVNYAPTDKADPLAIGHDAGEPSIGVNWKTGKVMYQAVLQTVQVTFDDSTMPAKATYKDVSNPLTGANTLDPILFTDSVTGRTFVSQLTPPCSVAVYTDTDGEGVAGDPLTGYRPSMGCAAGANFDHQTFSAGPAPASVPVPAYGPNRMVYYCSQVVAEATCGRSLDGGLTFTQSAPLYVMDGNGVVQGCTGLHGHLRVAPDGTAYTPNFNCDATDGPPRAGLIVAEPSPVLLWSIRTLPFGTTTADFDSDPGVGIDGANTAYLAWETATSEVMVAVTKDRALHYTDITDLGKPFGIKNATMPKVVGGSAGRAAVVFLGTPTEAPKAKDGKPENQLHSFMGEWHLYIATTYDSGKSWVTVDATPNDPVQRGCIWWGNVASARIPAGDKSCTSNPDRNLLDFLDVQVDKYGRVLAGYADGCIQACIKDKTSRMREDNMTIARQTCGRGLFAQYDNDPKGPLLACKKAAPAKPVSGVVKSPGGAATGGGTVTARPTPPSLAATGSGALVPSAALLLLAVGGGAVLLRRRSA